MTKAQGLKVARKLLLLAFLSAGFGVITSTDVTPVVRAQALCCYCDYLYNNCVSICSTGQPAYGCSSDCANCCRNQATYIPHCYATCTTQTGQSCLTNEDCPTGGECLNSVCVCP